MRKDVVETIIKKPHIEIEKWASDPYSEPGDMINYTIRVRNTGTGGAYKINVTDTPGTGFTIGSITNVQGTSCNSGHVSVASGVFTISIPLQGSLSGDGDYCQFTYNVSVANTVPDGTYVNTATVRSTDFDNTPLQQDIDEAYVTILSHPVISVNKTTSNEDRKSVV